MINDVVFGIGHLSDASGFETRSAQSAHRAVHPAVSPGLQVDDAQWGHPDAQDLECGEGRGVAPLDACCMHSMFGATLVTGG